ncbi:right-handed parallel beta-helix repeat-containing protein [Lutibacter sp. A64]|uniref:right-handed parallel beta-helix repeat-containing protein n=1 Tax=Lutibacter sp. A64 TaxID=2918526 RepID=UPI001F0622FB|nr:right-handed parallel beta-helix repeat-containing protein [Lutibacter sp. A64]UMB52415.1 right-handed parallel beta-helix repeat-containing protein [Lutibacter sp. A64]
MKKMNIKFIPFILILFFQNILFSKDYYVHPKLGNDTNTGVSKAQAFKTIERANKISFNSGDRLLLASGQIYNHGFKLINKQGTADKPISITSVLWNSKDSFIPATINFTHNLNGVLIENCSYVNISNIRLTANGYLKSNNKAKMHCAILIINKGVEEMKYITINNVSILDVYYEKEGFSRGKEEVRTANGTQKYGWGVRVINEDKTVAIKHVYIKNSNIKDVSHTGIKLTGKGKNISNIYILNNNLEATGGPGIQMSGVKDVEVTGNIVTHSGSNTDSRKWGRGSGLWTWSSSNVLIEKNKFLYANGPGDSAGAHIDFNCDNIVLQYNISAYNAGGFCEILGNNYNCAYRYNISINDGYRVKGVNGAFQEGKTIWLSGYQGTKKVRKGPVNTYIYNNTIYCDASIVSKIAFDNTSKGVLIANNIFHIMGNSAAVVGDQYKPDLKNDKSIKNLTFKNNLFLTEASWPKYMQIADELPMYGDAGFENLGDIIISNYIPKNKKLVKHKGIEINLLPNDVVGLLQGLKQVKDIMGNSINGNPSLGAIEPK